MMQRRLVILVFILNFSNVSSQLYKQLDWEAKPTKYQLQDQEKSLASIAIKEKYVIEYFKPKLSQFYKLFETKHSIIVVNSDKGINRHNRVYIPISDVINVIDIKARVIDSEGNITVLNKNNIKELKDVKDYGGFKVFALEGVTKASQLEILYTLQKKITSVGTIVVQKEYPIKNTEVTIRGAKSLDLDIKSYNKYPDLEEKTLEEGKLAYFASLSNIPGMIEEKSATPNANRMKVCYLVRPSYGFMDPWNNLKNNISERYLKISKKRQNYILKDFQDFQKKNKFEDQNLLSNISEYIVKSYQIINSSDPMYEDLRIIAQKKQASKQGIIKVYTALLNNLSIPYDLILTSNRYRHKFDQDFYSNLNLQQLLIYFEDIDKYLVPSDSDSRMGHAPHLYISNLGFHISSPGDGSFFEKIDVPDSDYTKTIRDFVVVYDETNTPLISCKQELTGFKAQIQREAYVYFSKKDPEEFKRIFSASAIEDASFLSYDVVNDDLKNITSNTPFILNWSYTAESLSNEIGEDIVFNLGKLIGTQQEFYQEEERVNPVEIAFPNKYKYQFEIEIPAGFRPKGLENLVIDKKLLKGTEELCKFVSGFEIKGNKVLIHIEEDYNVLRMELENYEQYKDVVNAAYDFSTLSIIFEKIK